MYAKQIAVMKGQAWNVVETLKLPDHGPLELTRRARVCVWDDLVEIPIAVPLQAPSADMRRKHHSSRHKTALTAHEEMDITALSTPPQKPQPDLLMNSPPLDQAAENRFNLSRESSSMDVRRQTQHGESNGVVPQSPATVQGVSWTSRIMPGSPSNNRPNHRPRVSYDAPRRRENESKKQHRRRYSLGYADEEDDEGDLGYAANEDLEGNRKTVIVERLEQVKSKNPVFTWC